MEIKGGTPKEVEYINTLLQQKDETGKLKKAFNKVTGKIEGQSKSELAEEINGTKTNSHAHEFLEKLIDEEALVKVGEKKGVSKPTPQWEVDRQRLLKVFKQTEFYQENKDVFETVFYLEQDLVDLEGLKKVNPILAYALEDQKTP